MKRRAFVALLGGVATWPLHLRAQQTRTPTVGLLILSNPEPNWTLLREGLREAGYVEGRNIELEFRAAGGDPKLLAEQAAELVRAKVDVIVAVQTPAVLAAMQATKDVPIVMLAGAPVETGLVASLSRPGGNVTGVSTTGREVMAKTLEIMREILPSVRRVAVLINGNDLRFGAPLLDHVRLAAQPAALDIQPFTVATREELAAAFAAMTDGEAQAVIVQPSLPRKDVLELALKHRLPTITSNATWAEGGAFMAYAAEFRDACRKAASYVDRILKGAKPADLPVELPTKFELGINLKTATALGIEIPPMVLARDAKLIE